VPLPRELRTDEKPATAQVQWVIEESRSPMPRTKPCQSEQ
jgi:hypothetical protein